MKRLEDVHKYNCKQKGRAEQLYRLSWFFLRRSFDRSFREPAVIFDPLLGYVVAVYLIFFLTYTPLDVDHVRGVQGRYFIIVLPVAAVFVAVTRSSRFSHASANTF